VLEPATGTESREEIEPQPARLEVAASRRRVAAAVEVVLASGLPTQLAVGAVLIVVGLAPYDATGRLSMAYLSALLAADTATLLGFIVWRLRAGGERTRAVMLGSAPWRREAWLGIGLLPVMFGGIAALMAWLRWAWPWLHNVGDNPFEALARTPMNAALLMALVVGGALKEEVQRAFVLHRFEQSLGGARAGLALYSVVFGAGHVMQGYDVGIATMLLGAGWGLVFLRRRSIVAPAVCHAGFNAAQIAQFVIAGS
jgi:membrane protease YdiL (CAAX protease family)